MTYNPMQPIADIEPMRHSLWMAGRRFRMELDEFFRSFGVALERDVARLAALFNR